MASSVTARLSTAAFAATPMEKSTIWFDPQVLESMRRVAQSAFDANVLPVAGILLGHRTSGGVRVTGWLAAATVALAVDRARVEHPEQAPLGWVKSKHQGEARFALDDLEKLGPVTAGVLPLAVVLRPSSQRPMRAACYWSSPGVALASERPAQEFFIQPGEQAAAPSQNAVPIVPRVDPEASPFRNLWMVDQPGSGASMQPVSRFEESIARLRWALPAALLIVVTLAGLAIRVFYSDPLVPFAVSAATQPAKPDPLQISAIGEKWLIRWQPGAAERATLVIDRGHGQDAISLTKSQYALGTYRISQQDGDVEVLLRTVKTGEPTSEIRARIVASASKPKPTDRKLSAELDQVKRELQMERTRRQQLQKMVVAPAVPEP